MLLLKRASATHGDSGWKFAANEKQSSVGGELSKFLRRPVAFEMHWGAQCGLCPHERRKPSDSAGRTAFFSGFA